MKVNILRSIGKNEKPYKDGSPVFAYVEGQQVDVEDNKAKQLIERGLVEPLDKSGHASSAMGDAINKEAQLETDLAELKAKQKQVEQELDGLRKSKAIQGVPPEATVKTTPPTGVHPQDSAKKPGGK